MKQCLIDDCDYPVLARSLCKMHYDYWRRGRLDVPNIPEPMTHAQAGSIGGKVAKRENRMFYKDRKLASEAGVKGSDKRWGYSA